MELSLETRVKSVLSALEKAGSKRERENLVRFGITAPNAWGISVGELKKRGKALGRDHALAAALWESGQYEARMLCSFIDEPQKVTAAQMDRWCRDFDNWGVCDTICFHLFDRTPHAFAKVKKWAGKRAEYEKRAGFVLLACLAGHSKTTTDAQFLEGLALIEREASDSRNFVKKALSWALRGVGSRGAKLNAATMKVSTRLAASEDPTERWLGREGLKEFARPAVKRRVARADRSVTGKSAGVDG